MTQQKGKGLFVQTEVGTGGEERGGGEGEGEEAKVIDWAG